MATLLDRIADTEGTVYQAGGPGVGPLLDFVVAFPTHNVFRNNVVPLAAFGMESWNKCQSFSIDRAVKPEDLESVNRQDMIGKFLVKFNPSSASVDQVMYYSAAGLLWIYHAHTTKTPLTAVRELDPGRYFWPRNQR